MDEPAALSVSPSLEGRLAMGIPQRVATGDCLDNDPLFTRESLQDPRYIWGNVSANCVMDSPVVQISIVNNINYDGTIEDCSRNDEKTVHGWVSVRVDNGATPAITQLEVPSDSNRTGTPQPPVPGTVTLRPPVIYQSDRVAGQSPSEPDVATSHASEDFCVEPAEDRRRITIDFSNISQRRFNATVTVVSNIGNDTEVFALKTIGRHPDGTASTNVFMPFSGTTSDRSQRLDAEFTWSPASPEVDQTVTFNASQSTGEIEEYHWDFDGDGAIDARPLEPTTTHTFEHAGPREVTLRVVASDDATATDEAVVQVRKASGIPVPFGPPELFAGFLLVVEAVLGAAMGGTLAFLYYILKNNDGAGDDNKWKIIGSLGAVIGAIFGFPTVALMIAGEFSDGVSKPLLFLTFGIMALPGLVVGVQRWGTAGVGRSRRWRATKDESTTADVRDEADAVDEESG